MPGMSAERILTLSPCTTPSSQSRPIAASICLILATRMHDKPPSHPTLSSRKYFLTIPATESRIPENHPEPSPHVPVPRLLQRPPQPRPRLPHPDVPLGRRRRPRPRPAGGAGNSQCLLCPQRHFPDHRRHTHRLRTCHLGLAQPVTG